MSVNHELLDKVRSRKPCLLQRIEVDGFTMELRQSRGPDIYRPRYSLVFWITSQPERIALVHLGDDAADAIDAFVAKVEFHHRMARR